MNRPITNFGGNVRFTPQHFYEPRGETEILAILDQHANGKIRAIGACHSWSPLIACDDAVIDLRHFDNVSIERTPDGDVLATVGGGCQIKHLLHKLHALGDVTILSLGLITEQTIAGAIATATHGSGRHSMSHYITEMRVAAYDSAGKACIYTWRDGPELRAARCALGCMGVVLAVRFRCVPKYDVAETIVPCATIDEALASEAWFPLQQFYLVPHLWQYFVQRRRVVALEPRRRLSAKLYRAWWFLNIDLGLHLVIKATASVMRNATAVRFFYRHMLSKLILKNRTVVDHSEHMLVMEHELFKHLEIEIFVPARHVRAAAAFVQNVLQVFDGGEVNEQVGNSLGAIGALDELVRRRGTFTHHYAVTFRQVLPDDTLISMSSGAETWYAISFITYVEPRDAFYSMAAFLASSMAALFDARLHWGKFFPSNRDAVERAYPNVPTFRALCRAVDPRGVFRNEFVDRVLFD
jgi:D-arabinono-1,4-lactone oxidase/FAD binding domain